MMRITLLGFGLLAGSIAAAVKQAKLYAVRAVSSKDTLAKARERGAADEFFEYGEVEKWLPGSDLILLCSPIKHIISQIEVLRSNAGLISSPAVVSDIGSSKEEICKAGFSLPAPFCFVGGHPMAGSEKRGFEHGDPSIFENAYWLYCLPKGLGELPGILGKLLDCLGSKPARIQPREHDCAMAWLSHAPQLLSTSIAAGISPDIEKNYLQLAGRGFRDMTRIAGSSWEMWKDIFETNGQSIESALGAYAEKALEIKAKLAAGRLAELKEEFLRGNSARRLLETDKNSLYEVVVHLSDEPGTILKVLKPIADNNINIRDIELAKVREGIGGILNLSFRAKEDAEAAIGILQSAGMEAACR